MKFEMAIVSLLCKQKSKTVMMECLASFVLL